MKVIPRMALVLRLRLAIAPRFVPNPVNLVQVHHVERLTAVLEADVDVVGHRIATVSQQWFVV